MTQSRHHRLGLAVVAAVALAAAMAGACAHEPAADRRSVDDSHDHGTARVVEYAPGLRIDFRVPQVEIDAEVILREGPLELFAYSRAPVPKEHESIVKTAVPCSRVYEALGLIGLRPGQTARYFPETRTERPASGDGVDVRVKYQSGDETVEKSACEWMFDIAAAQPMSPRPWVFSGSERDANGRFAADEDGTLVTVVDFPSSLLSLAASHSSSDEDLWLRAHTDAIPPVGTLVTLILRPAR
jgi:hypothetical protein